MLKVPAVTMIGEYLSVSFRSYYNATYDLVRADKRLFQADLTMRINGDHPVLLS